ncbi:MAG: diguanylate cyclase [Proteobacteria bacterium]|nr:diguanylate cyclase [Pseudomonadota bacterium]
MAAQSSCGWFVRTFGSPRVRLLLFFALTWLGIASLLVFLLFEGRNEAERKAQSDALGASALLEARLVVTLRRVHGDLEHFAASLPREALRMGAVPRFRSSILNELGYYSGRFPETLGFRIIDAAGNLLYASETLPSSVNFGDRSYFQIFAKGSSNSVFFSEVLVDRLSGRSSLVMALPLRDTAGELLGVLVAPLDVAYLSKMADALSVGENGVVSLRRTDDGSLILRRPIVPELVNQVVPNNPLHRQLDAGERFGTARFHATIDGVERIYGFRRVGDYPVYVITGLATADYLAAWRQTSAVAGVAALLLFLSLSLVLIRLLRAEKEEELTARRLMDSEERYRMLAENSHDVIWTVDIPSRTYTYVSPAIKEMSGYLPDEIVGQPVDVRLTPDSAARVARDIDQRLRRIAAGDKSASVVVSELEQECKNGEVITTEVVSSYLLDADGVARTILGITRNVSERKAVESALRETNRQLHARIEEIGRLQVALQELAVRDSLTGLYNRRYLDETLEREVSRARREGIPLSLVMLDIDHFKRVNDTYGHQVGDEVLRMLASTLLADIRAEDVACRYGGEEFLILLPNMPLETTMLRAQAWRSAVEALRVTHGNFQITFTISLGVAAYPEHGKTPDDLTRCADQALYRAKHEGRNQVSVFFG